MARFFKKREQIKGASPGTPIFIGEQKIDNPLVRLIDYDKDKLNEKEIKEIKEGARYTETNTVTWINIDGLHDTELIKQVGADFGLHTLLLEDIANTGQRPKLDEYDDHLYLVIKMVRFDESQNRVINEQLSIVIADKFLITFQERKGDVFEPVRERIRKGKGRIRTSGIDYLAYALVDTVVDNYIFTIEKIGEMIEDLEEEIIGSPQTEVVDKINIYKKEMNYLRKSIRPAREAIMKLARTESELIKENTYPFIKDLEDLVTQASEAIDTYRDMLSDQLNIYHTNLSNRMNDIMKVLTIFAAIFIPLTFIAGIYGTNFEYFPELTYKYSYFIFWGVMIAVTLFMIRYFKKKNWF